MNMSCGGTSSRYRSDGGSARVLAIALCLTSGAAVAQGRDLRAVLTGMQAPVARAEELLAYEIEGISFRTPLRTIASTLQARGYRRANPIEKPTGTTEYGYVEEFVKGELVSEPNGRAVRYFSAPGGFGYRVAVHIGVRDGKESIDTIRYERLMQRRTRGSRDAPGQLLPDTPDTKAIAALKADLCGRIADEGQRWQLCPPDTATEIAWRASGPREYLDVKSGELLVRFRAVASDAYIVLTYARRP